MRPVWCRFEIYWASTNLFEGALLMAMLGFVSTAALARYLPRVM
jgi:multisubunit Na+/H+ antiporter MnhF subunit